MVSFLGKWSSPARMPVRIDANVLWSNRYPLETVQVNVFTGKVSPMNILEAEYQKES